MSFNSETVLSSTAYAFAYPSLLRSLHVSTHAFASNIGTVDVSKDTNDDTCSASVLCPICLEAFVDSEDICIAKNMECPHLFHLKCIIDWC
jgi:RING-like zinc finger